MSITVRNGDTVEIDPLDKSVITFDWHTESLDDGVAISTSAFRITGVQPEAIAVASITRSVNTATVTTVDDHGYSTDDWVAIAGAVQTDYNVAAQITVTGAKTFTYAVANTPTTPATGTITAAAGLGFDNATILSSSPYSSRYTQLRVIGSGTVYLGRRFTVSNKITTDESPAQTKDRSFTVIVADL